MQLSRTHIALLIGLAMVIITINAAYRVRYFGEQERRLREEEAADAGPDAPQPAAADADPRP